ncbi:MAG TPA: GNAT family N-acetyltransferase [Bacillota bacterium]|nr:GNAT family N-acetyltransferase [Bacillota bacterium]
MAIEDISTIVELGNTVFSAEVAPTLYRAWDEAEVLRLYAAHKETCMVATQKDKLVGFGLGSLLTKPGNPWRYGWVEWLAVNPTCKRQHIARRLLKLLRERFVAMEVRIMLVDTYAGNRPALNLFRNFGFGQEVKHVYLSMNLDSHPRALERKFGDDVDI